MQDSTTHPQDVDATTRPENVSGVAYVANSDLVLFVSSGQASKQVSYYKTLNKINLKERFLSSHGLNASEAHHSHRKLARTKDFTT